MSDSHKCNVCSCSFTDAEGGVQGYFGIIPVSFCPTCFSCMCSMVEQVAKFDEEAEDDF